MRFVVIGPGALGSLFAASLSATGKHTVWLLDHNRQRAAMLAEKGLLLQNGEDEQHCPVRATADPKEIIIADCILLCVKSHQVHHALATNRALFETTPLTIAFQNGIGHLGPLAGQLRPGTWGVGVTAQGANLPKPGLVRHGGNGLTSLGFLDAPRADARHQLQQVAAVMNEANLETVVEPQIRNRVWQKLLVNAGINALTAIHDCANGELLHSASICQRMRQAILEGAAVAEAMGITLAEEPVARAMQVCQDTAGNISSMLQDVRNRRRTEIDAINNAIVREGHRLGIAVPENEQLVREINALEQRYLTDSP